MDEKKLLDAISLFAFEQDMYGVSHKEIAEIINNRFKEELSKYNRTYDNKPILFVESMVTAVVNFESLSHMLAVSKPIKAWE